MIYKSSSDEDFEKFSQSLLNESDRGLALIASSALDFDLGQLLRKTVVNNEKIAANIFNQSRPISSFSSRIDLSYLLGIISIEEHCELHTIRKIRNEFGHTYFDISFSTQQIKDFCGNLIFSTKPDASERGKFILSSAYLLGRLNRCIANAEHIAEAPASKLPAGN